MDSYYWGDAYGDTLKNPEHVEALLDRADDDRKRDRENGVRNPLVVAWEVDERAAAAIFGRCEEGTHVGQCIRPSGHDGGCYVVAGCGDD